MKMKGGKREGRRRTSRKKRMGGELKREWEEERKGRDRDEKEGTAYKERKETEIEEMKGKENEEREGNILGWRKKINGGKCRKNHETMKMRKLRGD